MDNKKGEESKEINTMIGKEESQLKENLMDTTQLIKPEKIVISDSTNKGSSTNKVKEIIPSKGINKDSIKSNHKPKVISHGSSEKAKIDSIKRAKAKLKK